MKIVNIVDIEATPEEVFSWLDDPERAKEWMTGVTRSEFIEKTPEKVGTTFHEYIEKDGRGIEMLDTVTEYVPDERFAVHLESDINTVDVVFSLADREGGTRLTQEVDLRLKGALGAMGLFLESSIRKKVQAQAQREFAGLKQLCEERQA